MSDSTQLPTDAEDLIDAIARRLGREASAPMSPHPETDILVAFQENRLPDREAAQIRWHLVSCARCSREVLQLGAFERHEPERLPSAAQTQAAWVSFQSRLGEDEQELSTAGVWKILRPPGGFPQYLRPWLPLAASILFALTGLAFWISGTTTQISDEPEAFITAQTRLFDLDPDGESLRRDTSGPRELDVPDQTEILILRLNLGDQTPHESYRVDISTAAGLHVQSLPGPLRQPEGTFIVLVSRAILTDSDYRVQLIALRGQRETKLASYSLRLRELSDE